MPYICFDRFLEINALQRLPQLWQIWQLIERPRKNPIEEALSDIKRVNTSKMQGLASLHSSRI